MKNTFTKIIQSKNDLRKYQIITLANDLECLLIQDDQTEKSAAAMNVNCGYLQDPVDTPGLAHFLEHMLFLGTQKYPNENEYKSFLSQNGGASNAYTSAMETNYYFSVKNDAIEGALDRFSQFFISPLFTESCTTRELQAVDSEHKKNLMQDNWRQQHLFRSSGKPGNPFTKFSTGCLDTLEKDNIRDLLLEFYQKSYSANLMKLVVYSNEDIEVQQKWCNDMFQGIPNHNLEKPKYEENPFDSSNMGQVWQVTPVMKKDILEFKWFIEYQHQYYKDVPVYQISHLVGHEGKNSLLSMLKEQGLAVGLSSGHSDFMNLFSVCNVTINLTKNGVKNIQQVYNIVFKYLKMLKEKGVDQWIHQEVAMINKIQFDTKFNEKAGQYVVTLGTRMQNYPKQDILQAPYMHENYDRQLIQKTLDSLKLENLRVYLYSQCVEDHCDEIEPIYNIKYSKKPFDENMKNIFENPQFDFDTKLDLDLPIPNTFLPKNLEVLDPPAEIHQYPQLSLNKKNFRLWHKQDTTFQNPKATVYLKLFSLSNKVPNLQAYRSYANMFQEHFKYEVQEFKYPADLANISSSASLTVDGIDIIVAGFNDSIPTYTEQFLQKLGSFNPSKQENLEENKSIFNTIYTKKKQHFENFFNMVPYAQIGTYQQCLLQDSVVEPEYQSTVLQDLSWEGYQEFAEEYLRQVCYEGLVVGNIGEQDAQNFLEKSFSKFEDEIKNQGKELHTQDLEQLISSRCVKLPENKQYFFEKILKNEKEQNSAILSYFQFQPASIKENLIGSLLIQYLKEPSFSQLRTVEQLGYITQVSQMQYRSVIGIQFLIQSTVQPPQYLGQRIEMFLEGMKERIGFMKDSEFQSYVDSLMSSFIEKDTSIYQESQRYVTEINLSRYQFDRRQQYIEELPKITKEEFIQTFNKIFFDQRKHLETHLVCQIHQEKNQKLKEKRLKNNLYNMEEIKSVLQFKNKMELYPDFQFRKNYSE